MSDNMDSLSSDEFEIIEGAEDSLNEMNDQGSWSFQQSIRLEPTAFELPTAVPNANQTLASVASSEAEKEKEAETLNDSSFTIANPSDVSSLASVVEESPILADSMASEAERTPVASIVNPTAVSNEPSLDNASIFHYVDSANSTINSANSELIESSLRKSLVFVQNLKNQLEAKTARVAEMEKEKMVANELETLRHECYEQSRMDAADETRRQGALHEQEKERMRKEFDLQIERAKVNAEIEMKLQAEAVEKLRFDLAAASQCADLWKQNSEKFATELPKLVEENKRLREQVDCEVARRLEETDLRKMFERQVSDARNGSHTFSYTDPPAATIAKQLADKNEYCHRLEAEISRLRDEVVSVRTALQQMKEHASNSSEIVNVLKEDQLESVREIKERDLRIERLTEILQRNQIINDEMQ